MSTNYLKIGKVSEKILGKWVFSKPISRPEVLIGPMLGEDCCAVKLAADETLILSTDPITATDENIAYLAVHVTLNDLAAAGAEPVGMLVTILLPPKYPESQLENIFKELHQTLGQQNLAILGGHTEVTDAVNRAVLSVTGVGKIKNRHLLNTKMEAGDKIIMTKYAAMEGTSILAKAKTEELATLYSKEFLQRAADLDRYISVYPESKLAMQCQEAGLKTMHDITEGGVLGAVWELSEKAGLGVEIDLEAIPVLQETVEITEFFDINPYKLISSGSMLIVAKNPQPIMEKLKQSNISAAIIGELISAKEKTVMYSGVRQSILSPTGDELYKVL